MENANYPEQVSKFFYGIKNDLDSCIHEMTKTDYGLAFMFMDVSIFNSPLNKLEKDCEELKIRMPTLPDLKSNFNNVINEILSISEGYISEYDSKYISQLDFHIEKEVQDFSQSGIIKHSSELLNSNPYNRLYEICYSIKTTIKSHIELKNQMTGFTCNLPPETVEQIFNLMVTSNQISGNKNDFLAIFNKTSIPFKNPVKWLIKRGENTNKLAFQTFLNLMTGIKDFTTKGNKEKIEKYFVGSKGELIILNKPTQKGEYSKLMNEVEKIINPVKEKTRPA